MQKIGGMSGILGMMPGVGKMKNQLAAAGSTTRSCRASSPSSPP
jgi:signal recognition particle subunit SRP54